MDNIKQDLDNLHSSFDDTTVGSNKLTEPQWQLLRSHRVEHELLSILRKPEIEYYFPGGKFYGDRQIYAISTSKGSYSINLTDHPNQESFHSVYATGQLSHKRDLFGQVNYNTKSDKNIYLIKVFQDVHEQESEEQAIQMALSIMGISDNEILSAPLKRSWEHYSPYTKHNYKKIVNVLDLKLDTYELLPFYSQKSTLEFSLLHSQNENISLPIVVSVMDGQLALRPFAMPISKKWILLNSDRLTNERGKAVILSHNLPSILNQRSSSSIITSWYGGMNTASKVNWNALAKHDVYYVIPHSDKTKSKVWAEVLEIYEEYLKNLNTKLLFISSEQNKDWLTLSEAEFLETASALGLHVNSDVHDDLHVEQDDLDHYQLKAPDEIEEHDEIIEGLMCSSSIMVLGGQPKLGKSIFSADLGYQISQDDGTWLNFKLKKHSVCIIDLEMTPQSYKKRGWADKQSDTFRIFTLNNEKPRQESTLERLHRYLNMVRRYVIENDVKVIIIDCVYRLIDESNKQQMSALVYGLTELKRLNKLVIVVHHTRKDANKTKGSPFQDLAGSSDLERAIDGGVMLQNSGENIKNSKGEKTQLINIKFMARDFKTPDDIQAYVDGPGKYKIKNKLVYDDSNIHEASQDDKVKYFIQQEVPSTDQETILKSALVEKIRQCSYLDFGESYSESLPSEWLKKGLLTSPKRGQYHAPKTL